MANLLTPEEFHKIMDKNHKSGKHLFGLVKQQKACADCFACKEIGYEGLLLAAQRGADSVVQCEMCFETYTQWVQKELTVTEVAATFATRMASNVKLVAA